MNGSVDFDEVQLAPELFRSIKVVVDTDPRPGRFLLTGSAQILALRQLPDALPGRMKTVELWPATLATESGIPRTTLNRYLELLTAVFLIKQIPAWSTGQTYRAIGTPKLAFTDTGIASHLIPPSPATRNTIHRRIRPLHGPANPPFRRPPPRPPDRRPLALRTRSQHGLANARGLNSRPDEQNHCDGYSPSPLRPAGSRRRGKLHGNTISSVLCIPCIPGVLMSDLCRQGVRCAEHAPF